MKNRKKNADRKSFPFSLSLIHIWQNNRQRVEVNVLKKEKDTDRTLEGAVFGLYAKEDIKSETTGKVLIEADEIIELKSTDQDLSLIHIYSIK